MAEAQTSPAGPDLAQGVTSSDLTGQTLLKHVGDQDVFLVGSGAEIFAIDAYCSHYRGAFAEELWLAKASAAPDITPADSQWLRAKA